jgi:hypothetical protein
MGRLRLVDHDHDGGGRWLHLHQALAPAHRGALGNTSLGHRVRAPPGGGPLAECRRVNDTALTHKCMKINSWRSYGPLGCNRCTR